MIDWLNQLIFLKSIYLNGVSVIYGEFFLPRQAMREGFLNHICLEEVSPNNANVPDSWFFRPNVKLDKPPSWKKVAFHQ